MGWVSDEASRKERDTLGVFCPPATLFSTQLWPESKHMKLDSLVTTPHGHAPVSPPCDQNWMREPECRFQNAIQGNLRTPPPFLCAWVTAA